MLITAISDTHGHHRYLTDILDSDDSDVIIHAGDASNQKDPALNSSEMIDFLEWYNGLDYSYHIYIPGNHDTALHAGLINRRDYPNVIFLENDSCEIDCVNIYGSPHTPSFGTGWAWNMKRTRIQTVWDNIPNNTDVLVTHGPPKGIMDLTWNKKHELEQGGCKCLLNTVKKVEPRFHIFGHFHDEPKIKNFGIRHFGTDTTFLNASIVDLKHNVVNFPLQFEI